MEGKAHIVHQVSLKISSTMLFERKLEPPCDLKVDKESPNVPILLVLGQSKMEISVFHGDNIFSGFSGAQNGDMPAASFHILRNCIFREPSGAHFARHVTRLARSSNSGCRQ